MRMCGENWAGLQGKGWRHPTASLLSPSICCFFGSEKNKCTHIFSLTGQGCGSLCCLYWFSDLETWLCSLFISRGIHRASLPTVRPVAFHGVLWPEREDSLTVSSHHQPSVHSVLQKTAAPQGTHSRLTSLLSLLMAKPPAPSSHPLLAKPPSKFTHNSHSVDLTFHYPHPPQTSWGSQP